MKIFTSCVVLFLYLQTDAQNYDESKVPSYTLPDALKASNGQTAKTVSDWEKKRRSEVLTLFEDHVYGQMPKKYDSLKFSIIKEASGAMNGRARLKEVAVSVWNEGKKVTINLVLFLPNNAQKPTPAFLLINNRSRRNTEPSRDTSSEFWPAEMVIDSGYAVGAFHVSDAAPDDKANYVNGVLRLYREQMSAENGMKAIGAWAWAASRVMDYFEKEGAIDASRVAIVGHSRGGKAALWTGAQDQRFALVFSNCSGNTGAALSRRRFGETVKRINDQFPHWFTNNYKKYNDNEDALPVDQHMLLALIAPRPVYVTSATKDLWADPRGSYLSLKAAEPVYSLYRKTSALAPEPPAVNEAIIQSYLGYHNREGIHDLTAFDWNNFIRFANYHYKNRKR